MSATVLPLLTPNDFSSDREVRWCPGCGDFSILSQLKKVLAVLDVPRANMVPATIVVDLNHLSAVLEKAAHHQGAAFVEISQYCNILKDGGFDYATDAVVEDFAVLVDFDERGALVGRCLFEHIAHVVDV